MNNTTLYLDFHTLAPTTLDAMAADEGCPELLRTAVAAEISRRGSSPSAPPVVRQVKAGETLSASFGGQSNRLAAAMERKAKEFKALNRK